MRKYRYLKRYIRIFFVNNKKRKKIENTFIKKINKYNKFLINDKFDDLIEDINILRIRLNLIFAIAII